VTEAEWLACTEPEKMLRFFQGKASKRKMRLFACALARGVWSLLSTTRVRKAVEAAERFADGTTVKREMTAAGAGAQHAAWAVCSYGPHFKNEQIAAASATARYSAYADIRFGTTLACHNAEVAGISAASLCDVLREIVGNPFRPITLSPVILTWNDGVVVRLAQAAYEQRNMLEGTIDNSLLAILADALEEAGCTDADILGHLRGPGPHVRGCWPVDLCLGKS
jgi:hypothetical protein